MEHWKSGTKIEDVEDMPVFRAFYGLALEVVKLTRGCHRDFTWLKIQVQRSAESVPANLTEGFYSQYTTEYVQSLYRCRREAHETQLHLAFGSDSMAWSATESTRIIDAYEAALSQLGGLIRSLERKIATYGKAKPAASYERPKETGAHG